MFKPYLLLGLLTMVALLAGCDLLNQPEPTPVPFNQFRIDDVRDAFAQAGVPITTLVRDMTVGRDAPQSFNDRYTFAVERIAPDGGQVLFFSSADAMQSWIDYVARLRADSSTRRSVVYTYVVGNVLMQLNADLLPDEAEQFEAALNSLTRP